MTRRPHPLLPVAASYAVVAAVIGWAPRAAVAAVNDWWPVVNVATAGLVGLSLVYAAIRADRSQRVERSRWQLWMLAAALLWIAAWLGRAFIAPHFGADVLDPTVQSLMVRYAYWWLYVCAGLFAAVATRDNHTPGTGSAAVDALRAYADAATPPAPRYEMPVTTRLLPANMHPVQTAIIVDQERREQGDT